MNRAPSIVPPTTSATIFSILATDCFTAPTVCGTIEAVVATWDGLSPKPPLLNGQTWSYPASSLRMGRATPLHKMTAW